MIVIKEMLKEIKKTAVKEYQSFVTA